MSRFTWIRTPVLVAALPVLLAACGGGTAELKRQLEEKKHRPSTHVEPLPEVKTYEVFNYDATGIRSPFTPPVQASTGGGPRPDAHRTREFLENYALDNLRMVGTMHQANKVYGLVQTADGLVHRVLPGNHVGQNDGKITAISESKISVVELVPDGLGGYVERLAAIPLASN
jgi:type IV pilus assembly protein PilP